MPNCRPRAHWLREDGYYAQTVRDVGLRDADDTAIWRYAEAEGCMILTKDEDFAARAQSTGSGPCVIWLRVGNTSNSALRVWLVPKIPEVVALAGQGARLVEIR